MTRLEPVSSCLRVPTRDSNPTEFEVHAAIYSALKAIGFDVRGEIQYKDMKTRRLYRFDLVIYKHWVASEIIEVKAFPVRHRNGLENTRQARRYRQFGIPVTFVYGEIDAKEFIEQKIKETHQ